LKIINRRNFDKSSHTALIIIKRVSTFFVKIEFSILSYSATEKLLINHKKCGKFEERWSFSWMKIPTFISIKTRIYFLLVKNGFSVPKI
jgi:hypothetical protein